MKSNVYQLLETPFCLGLCLVNWMSQSWTFKPLNSRLLFYLSRTYA